jgi:mono/diheme cytochrome c family protein
MRPIRTAGFAILLIGTLTAGLAARANGVLRQTKQSAAPAGAIVTPVAGPSWLNRLGIRYRDTNLGRGSGRYGASPNDPAVERKPVALLIEPSVVLTGADLYRLNCQACHHAEGTGAPPEVRSVVPAVQGSSLEMMRRQLQHDGRAGPGTAARDKASEARLALYRRIQLGGEKMPARGHLQQSDIDMLYAYLTQLAGSPDARPQTRTTVTWARLGENVVKGTCHICHDAVGPRPSGRALLEGAIPPLTVLLADKPVVEFVNKVRTGAPIYMGDPPMHYRGRMPVFDYLKDQEVAAAYSFLTTYPPQRK